MQFDNTHCFHTHVHEEKQQLKRSFAGFKQFPCGQLTRSANCKPRAVMIN